VLYVEGEGIEKPELLLSLFWPVASFFILSIAAVQKIDLYNRLLF